MANRRSVSLYLTHVRAAIYKVDYSEISFVRLRLPFYTQEITSVGGGANAVADPELLEESSRT